MTKIQITQAHIDKGFTDDCQSCPTARAINDVLVPYAYAVVRSFEIHINQGNEVTTLRTPIEVMTFIYRFDTGEKVEPLEFELYIPQELLRK